MVSVPDARGIASLAARLGMQLGDDDAQAYRDFLAERLTELDDFVQSRADEDQPPLLYPERAPGHRPSSEEDPYGAWLWRCTIGGGAEGVLAGKTVSFKDHIAVAGIPLTFGSYPMDGFVPDIDATVVTRVLAAGGVVVGKNSLIGFTGGYGPIVGYRGDYGDPKNPRDVRRTTGGSSSGCAAAVAAGDVDIAFGGDQGGSIRIPSAYCGIVGLKPTFGLVSHMGAAYGADPTLDHIGPMARRVEDVAAALQAVAGYTGDDPRQAREVPEAIDALTHLADGVDGLRIGILSESFADDIDPDVRDGVLEAIDVLARAGATVTKVSVPQHLTASRPAGVLTDEGFALAHAAGMFPRGSRVHYPTSIIRATERMLERDGDHLKTYFKVSLLMGELSRRNFHGAAYAKAQNMRPAFVRAYDAALSGVDLLVMPTCPTVAPELPADLGPAPDERRQIEVLREMRAKTPRMRNLMPFDYTGHPALALPCGESGGLPFSLQLVGRYFDEPLILRAAYAYECAVGGPAPDRGAR